MVTMGTSSCMADCPGDTCCNDHPGNTSGPSTKVGSADASPPPATLHNTLYVTELAALGAVLRGCQLHAKCGSNIFKCKRCHNPPSRACQRRWWPSHAPRKTFSTTKPTLAHGPPYLNSLQTPTAYQTQLSANRQRLGCLRPAALCAAPPESTMRGPSAQSHNT